jgi:hypothetical protein
MRRPIYHNHYLSTFFTPAYAGVLITFAHPAPWLTKEPDVFVCQKARVLFSKTKTAPAGRFALETRGLSAYPRLVLVLRFRIHVERSISEGPRSVNTTRGI